MKDLNDLKPCDKVKGYPIRTNYYFRRLSEILPGMIDLVLLTLPFIIVLFNAYYFFLIFINILALYWSFRAFRYLYGIYKGIRSYNIELKIDWINLIKNKYNTQYQKLKYVLIYPVYKENLETIEKSIAGWVNSDIDTKKISLVVALEEKYSQKGIKNFNFIKNKYGDKLREIIIVVHPVIEGEVKGVKGANINYASREFVDILKTRGESLNEYLLFTFDSDQIPHRKYMSAITYKYLSQDNPYNKFYTSAVSTFNNNLWRVPILIRLFSRGLTLTVMQNWALKKWSNISPDCWSSYAVNLKTVADVGFWLPDVESDDTSFFWNAILHFDGDFQGVETYVPTFNDAVESTSLIKSYKALYRQQYRWGWGIVSFSNTITGMYYNKKIPLKKKFDMLWNFFINHFFMRVVSFLIVLGVLIVNILHQVLYSSHHYLGDVLPDHSQIVGDHVNSINLLDSIFTLASPFLNLVNNHVLEFSFHPIIGWLLISIFFLNIPIFFLQRKICPFPKDWKGLSRIIRVSYDFISIGFIIINLLTFGMIPYVLARFKLMFGQRPKSFFITKKYNK
ncbi:MAG: glycosyltransferase family 2 protein [Methanobrevibacter sp.]|nr:glycosyltransferase family 2 protein [Methanobrevibacter sp.]